MGGLSFEEAQSELISAIEGVPPPIPDVVPAAPPQDVAAAFAAEPPTPPQPTSTPAPETSVYTSGAEAIVYTSGSAVEPEPEVVPPAPDSALFDSRGAAWRPRRGAGWPAPAPIEALLAAGSGAPAFVEAVSQPESTEAAPFDLAAALDRAAAATSGTASAEDAPRDGAAGAVADNPLAALEASLREHVPEPVPATPVEDTTSPLAPVQQAIVDDLERWLEDLVLARSDDSERA